VDALEPQQDQRPALVAGRGEEQVRLALQERLLLGLVPHEEHGDVGPEDARPAGLPLRVGPDEALAGDPEVEALALDLDDPGSARASSRTSSAPATVRPAPLTPDQNPAGEIEDLLTDDYLMAGVKDAYGSGDYRFNADEKTIPNVIDRVT